MDILVSIIMLTYNHEQFIAKAIESVIQQQTSFTYELIIGEDCSTDKTREICLIYKNKYPDKIKLLLHEPNIGMQVNAYKSLTSCTGKYIALCEGDDYWTDPYKLQKQVDFLESNPEFSLCHHRYNILYQKENKFELAPIMTNESNLLGCLTDHNISTLTCVFRKKNIEPYLTNFLDFKIGDLPIKLISASTGKIKYFSECMGVYRVHTKGAWNSIDQIDRKMIKIDTLAQLSTLELPSESIALICKFIGIEYFTLFQIQAKLGLHANATSSFQKATNYNTEYVSSEVVNWFINNHVDINNETYQKFINFIKRLKSKIFFNH